MDAVHLMRAITGRSRIVKVEGCYHGHHDSVQVSVSEPLGELGPAHGPASAVASTGIPAEIVRLTSIVPYNDLEATERLFAQHPGEIAGMLVLAEQTRRPSMLLCCSQLASSDRGELDPRRSQRGNNGVADRCQLCRLYQGRCWWPDEDDAAFCAAVDIPK